MNYLVKHIVPRLLPIVLFVVFTYSSPGQQPDTMKQTERVQPSPESHQLTEILREVREALTANSTESLTKHFAKRVYLNLLGDGKGYFSGNQAHYIIRKYLEQNTVVALQLNEQRTDNQEPFLSGSGTLSGRAKKEPVHVYIGFVRVNDVYQISQFTIY